MRPHLSLQADGARDSSTTRAFSTATGDSPRHVLDRGGPRAATGDRQWRGRARVSNQKRGSSLNGTCVDPAEPAAIRWVVRAFTYWATPTPAPTGARGIRLHRARRRRPAARFRRPKPRHVDAFDGPPTAPPLGRCAGITASSCRSCATAIAPPHSAVKGVDAADRDVRHPTHPRPAAGRASRRSSRGRRRGRRPGTRPPWSNILRTRSSSEEHCRGEEHIAVQFNTVENNLRSARDRDSGVLILQSHFWPQMKKLASERPSLNKICSRCDF